MGLFRRQPKAPPPPLLDRKRSLDGIPTVNPGVHVERIDNDRVEITVLRIAPDGLLGRFMSPKTERTVRLDEVGTFVLDQCDGKRSTRDVIDTFVSRYRTNRREAELSCVQFLKMLAGRGVISIVIR